MDVKKVNKTELYVVEHGSSFHGWKRLFQFDANFEFMVEEVDNTILASPSIDSDLHSWYISAGDMSRFLRSDEEALEFSAVQTLNLPGYTFQMSIANDACLARWMTNGQGGRFALYRCARLGNWKM